MEIVKLPTHVRFKEDCAHGNKGEVVEISEISMDAGVSTVESSWVNLSIVEFLHDPDCNEELMLLAEEDKEEFNQDEIDEWNRGL